MPRKHGWELHIDGVGVTQSRTLDTAEQMVRDYIETLTDKDVSGGKAVITPDLGELDRKVTTVRELLAAAASYAGALLGWQAHLRAGLCVSASAATVGPGTVVVLGAGAGAARVSAPCRVVYLVAEPGRAGFAYGTLPGHPERGEEV